MPTLPTQNPFEAARLCLINRLLTLKAPKAIGSFATPFDFEAIKDHVLEATAIYDEWLAAIGSTVRDNATTHISAGLFSGTFTAAVDGNETYAVESQGEALKEFASERRSERRASW